jgi:hypothetical protein
MRPSIITKAALLAAVAAVTVGAAAYTPPQAAELVVHEWGTFTTVADQNGRAVEWLPLGGPQDLPCFVERFRQAQIKFPIDAAPILNYEQARGALRGTVRMETPVVYFYTPRPVTVSVTVGFPQGLISEWYPTARVVQPAATPTVLRARTGAYMSWTGVELQPGATPHLASEGRPSHYYAARATDAVPVRVAGQDEKFLFYRGVGGFAVPLEPMVTSEGRIRIANRGAEPVAAVVLFERRGSRMGYRIHRGLAGEITLDLPALDADMPSLNRDLEALLVGTGLYAKEARAMVETWRDSWFEDGARVLYLVPPSLVDAILPLAVHPAPARTVRTFVGRAEVLTPTTLRDVRDAIAEADDAALAPYGRFLEPIAERIMSGLSPADRARTDAALQAAYRSYATKVLSYCR